MKYNILLRFLRLLVYAKRFFWWMGSGACFVLGKVLGPVYRFLAFSGFKITFYLKKAGILNGRGVLARNIIQLSFLMLFFIVAIPQTKAYTQKNIFLPGQKTLAFNLFSGGEDYSLEEVSAELAQNATPAKYNWRAGVAVAENIVDAEPVAYDQDLAGTVAGGMAINKPNIMTGSVGKGRRQSVDYIIEPGDSLNSIARNFGVNVATILWENGLNVNSKLKLGQKLTIPPTSGVVHVVRKGDNLKKIAILYGAKMEDVINFNNLDEDGTDLRIGERIMVPGGVRQEIKTNTIKRNIAQSYGSVVRPPASSKSPGAKGFIWPSAAHMITQYFGWKHHGLDIAGPFESAIYAAKAGVVQKSQCGWNSGYGCQIIIDHGDGTKTLYGHSSRLLVSAGEQVDRGQTIALMGNTGNVRGRTGIHLHFEVLVNGMSRVNPLGYVR